MSATALYSGEPCGKDFNFAPAFDSLDRVCNVPRPKPMGDWGGKSETNLPNVHITQTNKNADVGVGAHVTTNISGTQVKVGTYFDSSGNFIKSEFGKR